MKKLLLICLAVIGISAVSHAQGGGMRRSPADQVAQLKTSLALTDDQSAKILAIYTAQAKTQDSLRTAGADRSAMMAVRTTTMTKINAVLTPDQAATFKKQQDEMRARMQQGGGMGGGGGTPPPPSNR